MASQRLINIFMITILFSILSVLSIHSPINDINDSDVDYRLLSEAVNQLAINLYQKPANKEDNYFISPYSIWTALCVCYIGANGETRDELRKLLSIKSDEKRLLKQVQKYHEKLFDVSLADNTLEMANRIFYKQGFRVNESYVEAIDKYFGVDVKSVDFTDRFGTANSINQWVSKKTNRRITNLVDSSSIDELTRLIAANAVYFKGTWLNRFDEAKTMKNYEFESEDGRRVVDMMRLHGGEFKCSMNPRGLQASVCELPYVGEKLSMTILLPDKPTSLRKLEETMDKETINAILEDKPLININLYLPKFKLEYKSFMNKELNDLGVKLAFSPKADFTGISSDGGLYISDIVHQAVIDVNEEGTEAAAATKVAIQTRSSKPDFICDRPFMIIIHDNFSKSILFIGRFSKP